MFLLIFESLSFTEIAVIGIIALVVLGPRRLPELARKAGKIMSEFRKVTSDFKETWEREASLDDDTKQILSNPFVYEDKLNSENSNKNILPQNTNSILAPEIKEVSQTDLQALKEKAEKQLHNSTENLPQNSIKENSKQNWL